MSRRPTGWTGSLASFHSVLKLSGRRPDPETPINKPLSRVLNPTNSLLRRQSPGADDTVKLMAALHPHRDVAVALSLDPNHWNDTLCSLLGQPRSRFRQRHPSFECTECDSSKRSRCSTKAHSLASCYEVLSFQKFYNSNFRLHSVD